jgi:hypothetical protein
LSNSSSYSSNNFNNTSFINNKQGKKVNLTISQSLSLDTILEFLELLLLFFPKSINTLKSYLIVD